MAPRCLTPKPQKKRKPREEITQIEMPGNSTPACRRTNFLRCARAVSSLQTMPLDRGGNRTPRASIHGGQSGVAKRTDRPRSPEMLVCQHKVPGFNCTTTMSSSREVRRYQLFSGSLFLGNPPRKKDYKGIAGGPRLIAGRQNLNCCRGSYGEAHSALSSRNQQQ